MQLAMIGLGRMGMNMAGRLLLEGHRVVAYNRTVEKTDQLVKDGAIGAYSLSEVVKALSPPRIVWIMLPAGSLVDAHLEQFRESLSSGDIIIDGGNTRYKDDIRRARFLGEKGIQFVDVGVSGGIWGLKNGYCLMLGGDPETCRFLDPIFKSLAPKEGYLHCGDTGAGHFVKMVHNGIEYGLMQAYGEGFEMLKASPYSDSLNFEDVAHLWNQGSVVRSWLLELMVSAFSKDPRLANIRGVVADSGEGRWTIEQAVESGVSVPVIALSLMARFRSQTDDAFSDRVVAALRQEFGGHAILKKTP